MSDFSIPACTMAIQRFFIACPVREARFGDLTAAVVLFGDFVPSQEDLSALLSSLVASGMLYTRISEGTPRWGLPTATVWDMVDINDEAFDLLTKGVRR